MHLTVIYKVKNLKISSSNNNKSQGKKDKKKRKKKQKSLEILLFLAVEKKRYLFYTQQREYRKLQNTKAIAKERLVLMF